MGDASKGFPEEVTVDATGMRELQEVRDQTGGKGPVRVPGRLLLCVAHLSDPGDAPSLREGGSHGCPGSPLH